MEDSGFLEDMEVFYGHIVGNMEMKLTITTKKKSGEWEMDGNGGYPMGYTSTI